MNGDNYLAALERQVFFADEHVQGSVRWYIRWYRERAPAKRCWFRIWGGVALVASISLPFALSFFPEADKPQVAAKNFVLAARAAITDETKSYFEEVKFPNLNLKGQ
ncbi:MAG: hypothetical protein RBS40_12150 [Rhodocyclaceae bacterium]|jgi:hypothetical protein|nr:hypothetical protein [Rhodocyclaceae bacterium]